MAQPVRGVVARRACMLRLAEHARPQRGPRLPPKLLSGGLCWWPAPVHPAPAPSMPRSISPTSYILEGLACSQLCDVNDVMQLPGGQNTTGGADGRLAALTASCARLQCCAC